MSATSTVGAMKESMGWSIGVSVMMILAGAVAIALPWAAAFAVNILVGWLLVFSGVAHFVFAAYARRSGGVIWEILLGLLYVVTGGYLLFNPLLGLVSLTLVLAAYLFAEGVLELILSFRTRPAPGWG